MNSADHPSAIRSRNEIAGALLNLMENYPYNEITVKQIILETDLVRKISVLRTTCSYTSLRRLLAIISTQSIPEKQMYLQTYSCSQTGTEDY